jgi:hypothetical protein
VPSLIRQHLLLHNQGCLNPATARRWCIYRVQCSVSEWQCRSLRASSRHLVCSSDNTYRPTATAFIFLIELTLRVGQDVAQQPDCSNVCVGTQARAHTHARARTRTSHVLHCVVSRSQAVLQCLRYTLYMPWCHTSKHQRNCSAGCC